VLEAIKALWKREPVRVLYIAVVVAFLVYEQWKAGVSFQEIIEAVFVVVAAELARSQVTPMRDPRLSEQG